MDWSKLLDNNGLAVVIIIALGIAGWRIACFISPQITKLVERQIAFLDSLQSTTETQTKILEKHSEKIDAIHRKVIGEH